MTKVNIKLSFYIVETVIRDNLDCKVYKTSAAIYVPVFLQIAFLSEHQLQDATVQR